jgi:hypothetical protein
MTERAKSHLQEKLVALYLRLNGYFSTGLIIQSAEDNNVDGEVDIIGVRFCNHRQKDRLIECSRYLDIPNDSKIDIIIGEVKGGKKSQLQFNESIRENDDRRYKLLTWLGFVEDKHIDEINEELRLRIQTKEANSSEKFERINYPFEDGIISIRPMLFAPDRAKPRNNQVRFINGQQMIDFCWECFKPKKRRETCATDYWAINNWGEQFENLVTYFKQPNKTEQGTMQEMYEYFEEK